MATIGNALSVYGKRMATNAANKPAAVDNREKDLISQFAQARQRIAGQRTETERQSNQSLNRLSAIAGGTGGAIEEAKQRAIRDIGSSFGDVEAGLGAQEAQAKQALASQQIGERLQQEALDFQKNSFYAELDENKKTNLINAAIAVKDAGLQGDKRWGALLRGYFGGNFNTSFNNQYNADRQRLSSAMAGGNAGNATPYRGAAQPLV